MAGKFALIIGNSRYDDSNLGRLKAPDLDAQGLEDVLKSSAIGHFDEVVTLLNEDSTAVRKAIARFYDRRHRNDLLLLYFSGHGVKDEEGHLYLALRDTEIALLAGSAIETSFIAAQMDRSFSKRQVLVLDCCHSGAFAGAKSAQGASVGTAEAFEGTGVGRVILTATDSTQYAWEGDRIIGDAESSLFTHFLVDGLRTGAADRNRDGEVTVDELYDYVREQVVDATPRQTPRKWTYRQEGDIVLARNPFARDSTLPLEIEEARSSKLSSERLHAVQALEKLLGGQDESPRAAALTALKELALDDSRRVANAAIQALKAQEGNLSPPVRRTESGQRTRNRGAPASAESRPAVETGGQGFRSDIFISYEHHDRHQARLLSSALVAQGWSVWWDRRIAVGEAFDVVIERELATSRCVIVLWSGRSVRATWVRNEARRAARRGVLVPILIEPVEPPLEFENLQAADLTAWEDANVEHPEFTAVVDRIRALAPSPRDEAARREHERKEAIRRDDERAEAARQEHERAQAARQEHERAEATRREHERAEAARREHERAETARREHERAEAARREHERDEGIRRERAEREQRFAAARAHIEDRLAQGDLDAAEQALTDGNNEFGSLPEWSQLRDRLRVLGEQARLDELARDRLHTRPTPPDIAVQVEPPNRGWPSIESRGLQAAIAGLFILIAASGIVLVRQRRAPVLPGEHSPPVQQMRSTQPGEPSTSGPPPSSVTGATAPTALPSEPVGVLVPMRPVVRNSKPDVSALDAPAPKPPPPGVGVEALRSRARGQHQSGDHAQALTTVVEGLRLYPKDAGLSAVLTALVGEARSGAAQSKQAAIDLEAKNRAADLFAQGLRREGEAVRLQRSGPVDAAVRAWWAAADQFEAASARAEQVAEEEVDEQIRKNKSAERENRTQPPPQPKAKPLPDSGVEQGLVDAALRRYEAAYANLNAEAVRNVYSAAPVDQLTRAFAGYQSYVLKIKVGDYSFLYTDTVWVATVPATVYHEITPKSGKPITIERSQTFQLVKQGDAWVIRQVR